MANDLPTIPDNLPPQGMNNYGNGVQMGVNNGDVYILQSSDSDYQSLLAKFFSGLKLPQGSHTAEWSQLDSGHYNLFVLDNETYSNDAFCIPKRSALTKYTGRDLYDRYKNLDAAAKYEICHMPCIFANRNDERLQTDHFQPVVIGRVREIYSQTDNIKFVFDGYRSDISQQLINESVKELGLAYAPLRNELDEEHWSIKTGNLKAFLVNNSIAIP